MATYDVLTINPEGTAVGILCTPHAETKGLEIPISCWDYFYNTTTTENSRDYNKLQLGDSNDLMDTRVCKPAAYDVAPNKLAYKVWKESETDLVGNTHYMYTDLPDMKVGGKVYIMSYYTQISSDYRLWEEQVIATSVSYNGNYIWVDCGFLGTTKGSFGLTTVMVYEVD